MYSLSTQEEDAARPSSFNELLLGETKVSNQILHDVKKNRSIRTTSPANHTWRLHSDTSEYRTISLGTPQLSYSLIGVLSISQITFIAPTVTKCVHNFDTRPTLLIGVVLEAGSLIAASFVPQLWHLFIA
jgi:hypothetical protein